MSDSRISFVPLIIGFVFFVSTLFPGISFAGSIAVIDVTESSVTAADTSTYTFKFTPSSTINSGNWGDGAYFQFDFDNDFTVSSATLGSISPGVTGMAINNRNDSTAKIMMYSSNGSAVITGGVTYTVVINNVQNPASPGPIDAHTVRTFNGNGQVDIGSIAGEDIVAGASNPPAVSSQIPDKSNLEESEGVTQYVANLNNHFIDLDGDTLNFTASSSDSSTVGVSLSGANNRTLSLQAKKFGSADITVTATSADGFVDDTFNVSTIGALGMNSVSSSSNTAGQTTTLTFSLTLETASSDSNGDGAYIYFDLPSQYGVTDGSTTVTVSSPSVAGSTHVSEGLSNVWFIASASTIPAGTYTVTISHVTNPGSAGSYGNANVDTRNGGGTTYDKGSIALPTIGASNAPTVTSPISDQTDVQERDGVQQIVADLNNHFDDADGDTLTFTASSSDPLTVGVTTSGTNGRILSIEAKKYGSATITVTATSSDGAVDDEFDVDAIGELVINSISSSSDVASQTTDLTVNFTLETTVTDSGGDGAYLYFNYPSQYGIDGSTAISVTSPSVPGTTHQSAGASDVWFIASASTIPAGTYTAVISNVTNPSSGGSYGNLELDTRDGGSTIFDISSSALPSIAAGSVPTVSSPIPDETGLREFSGTQETVSDLNNHFTDGNGDTLNFTVHSVGDSSIVTAALSGANNRTLSLTALKSGTTTVTIRADDSIHGTVDDTFTVSTIGLLQNASVTPDTMLTGTTGSFDVSLTNESAIPMIGFIHVDFPNAFDVSGVGLSNFSGGGASAAVFSKDEANAVVNITITSGSVPAGTPVSFALYNIVTPSTTGNPGQYYLWTTDGTDTLDERFVNGDTFSQSYTVTYEGNGSTGGTVPTDSNTYGLGDTVTVLGNSGNLVRTDYKFNGWNAAADGSGTAYAAGTSFSMGSENVTLYAQWLDDFPWMLFIPAFVRPQQP